ncbi:hypothetical protein GCM10009841_08710 [Microlunatus panaciterrae]|uniref:Uncharacterized protein n=1 Tax=Microlunatus panaciterrae TaxID=400768 RepID=A0ABS2RLQ7_9ACTN|nr:hypothetical protein [Microlunatus panaciterrae]MBM7799417.1 hypothetical protein [Microlunatus panaciterrae]
MSAQPPAGAVPPAPTIDFCRVLTAAEIGAVTGDEPRPGVRRLGYSCWYAFGGDTRAGVLVSDLTAVSRDLHRSYQSAYALAARTGGARRVPAIGEAAFVSTTLLPGVHQGLVIAASHLVKIDISGGIGLQPTDILGRVLPALLELVARKAAVDH